MKGTLILIIVILVLTLVIIGIIAYAVAKVRRKMKEISRQAFGTDNLMEGFRKQEAEYAATPKSVSGMTSVCLPKINRDFPSFNFEQMRTRSNVVLTSYLAAVNSLTPGRLEEGGEELKDKLETVVGQIRNSGRRTHYDDVRIHRTEIRDYVKRNGRCVITFQSSVQYHYYETNDEGKVVKGSKDVLKQTRYEVDLVYIQDQMKLDSEHFGRTSMSLNCPNCGAAITHLGEKICPYCGTGIREIDIRVWAFEDVREIAR